MDRRKTADVDETRCTCNLKPFRNAGQKQAARLAAFKPKSGKFKGTYISYAERREPVCTCGAADRKRQAIAKRQRKARPSSDLLPKVEYS